MKLTIGYFYPELLNLYGDNGNVEILCARSARRNIDIELIPISLITKLTSELMHKFNFVFMGGGPDAAQKDVYHDLVTAKGDYLRDYIDNGGVGLFICGSFQLLGKYYKAADGSVLEGLSIFDAYTEHPGDNARRCIGNVVCYLNEHLLADPVFQAVNHVGDTLAGFENHGGRTFLESSAHSFARVAKGYGNNHADASEGIWYKNAIGTYLHGPVLARNPHLADYFICKSLNVSELAPLDDELSTKAHFMSLRLKQ